jgi:c-di-GMP-binding flagellar brake protein YcgR
MRMSRSDEKRRHPRVAKRIRVRSRFEGAVELETVDLSIGGLSCTAPMSLPVMTKLALSLNLPDNGGSESEQVIEGEAVVVRSEPSQSPQEPGFRIALFFSRMEEEHRKSLVEYLNRHNL